MARTRIAHAVAAPLAAALVVAACRTPPMAREDLSAEPLRAASREELARALDGGASAVTALRGKLTLGLQERGREGFRTCRGVLAARSPWRGDGGPGLYVKGYRSLVPTLFTLVSDGRSFWLHVPRDNVVYTGPVAHRREPAPGREVPVEARDLFRALFLEPLAAGARLDVAEEGAAYVVSVLGEGGVERRLWVERRRFTVRREVFYGPAGEEELAIDRERWVESGGRLYPARLVLRDPARGGAVVLDFERVTVDPTDLGPDAFRPRVPSEARTERVGGGEDAP